MKRNLTLSLLSFIVLAFFTACAHQNADSPINELSTFVTEITANADIYSAEEWEQNMDKYNQICTKLSSMTNKMSEEESQQAASLCQQFISAYTSAVPFQEDNPMYEPLEDGGDISDLFE